jgi:hypothetical protein
MPESLSAGVAYHTHKERNSWPSNSNTRGVNLCVIISADLRTHTFLPDAFFHNSQQEETIGTAGLIEYGH